MSNLSDKLIETELIRKKIYEKEFIEWAIKQIPEMNYKEICHLLLRYLFNKIITRRDCEDPIFIETKSPLAEEQLKKDFLYRNIKRDPQIFIDKLERKFCYGAKTIIGVDVIHDHQVSLSGSKIIYRTWKYEDISSLAKKYPSNIKYALALNIRYNYLKLENHGLSRVYKEIARPEDGIEAFASAFNHYFDTFCSAFPDLEKPFGSMGSFFNKKDWSLSKIYMNPPFDESLMSCAMDHVIKYCENSRTYVEFLCTFPQWDNFPSIKKFKMSKWVKNVKVYKKGEIPFVDYMNEERIIHPCGIIEVNIGNEVKK